MKRAGVGFIASLESEQRLRYYYWWKKYIILKRVAWFAWPLMLSLWLLQLAHRPFSAIASLATRPLFFVAIVASLWWSLLECPRCGERFRAWYTGDLDYFGDDCQNCGLTSSELSSIGKPRL